MESNPLHNAMIRYIHNKTLMIRALNPETWYRFKQVEGDGLADNHTVTDLSVIFRDQILPNIRNYECVQQDPNIAFYMGHSDIVVPDDIGPNQYPNVSNVEQFEAQRSYANQKDTLDVSSPIVTDDIISLSHAVSTRSEIQRASMHSINECVARLRYIQNEQRTTNVVLHVPNQDDIKTHHEAVAAAHHLDAHVRLPDVMDKNPQQLTAQNRPLLLMDPNRLPEQGGSETLHTSHARPSILPIDVSVIETGIETVIETGEHGLPNFADLLPANVVIAKKPIIIGKGFPDIFNIKRQHWPVLRENEGWEKFYPKVSGPIRPRRRSRQATSSSIVIPSRILRG